MSGFLIFLGGPGENRTRDSAMRMLHNTTLLQAPKYISETKQEQYRPKN